MRLALCSSNLPREEDSCATYNTGGFSEGQKRVWQLRSPTSRYVRNFEDDFVIAAGIYMHWHSRKTAPQLLTRAPRVATRNRSGVTKQSSIPYRETILDGKLMRGFSEAVRMPASRTHMDITGHSGGNGRNVGRGVESITNTCPRHGSLTLVSSFLLLALNIVTLLGEITLYRRSAVLHTTDTSR